MVWERCGSSHFTHYYITNYIIPKWTNYTHPYMQDPIPLSAIYTIISHTSKETLIFFPNYFVGITSLQCSNFNYIWDCFPHIINLDLKFYNFGPIHHIQSPRDNIQISPTSFLVKPHNYINSCKTYCYNFLVLSTYVSTER